MCRYPINTPHTKEEYYYRSIFDEHFKGMDRSVNPKPKTSIFDEHSKGMDVSVNLNPKLALSTSTPREWAGWRRCIACHSRVFGADTLTCFNALYSSCGLHHQGQPTLVGLHPHGGLYPQGHAPCATKDTYIFRALQSYMLMHCRRSKHLLPADALPTLGSRQRQVWLKFWPVRPRNLEPKP